MAGGDAACPGFVARHELPSAAGIVRVDSGPSAWQPMQSVLFIRRREISWVTSLGMFVVPPKSFAGGIFSIEYQ